MRGNSFTDISTVQGEKLKKINVVKCQMKAVQ